MHPPPHMTCMRVKRRRALAPCSESKGREHQKRAREESKGREGTCPPREIQSIMAENTHPCPGPNVAKSIPPLPPGTILMLCDATRNTQH
jgi:hypothetical protein